MSDANRKRLKLPDPIQDILDNLTREIAESEGDLQNENNAIRRAWDRFWRIILQQPSNYENTNIFTHFSHEVESRRSEMSRDRFDTVVMSCPQERQPGFQHGSHQMCLEHAYWLFFHNLLRTIHGKIQATHLMCCITYSDGTTECFTVYNQIGVHAEIIAINRIMDRLENSNRTINRVAMYITRSPCGQCCEQINNLIRLQPTLSEFYIRFSSVYEHYNGNTMRALNELRHSSDRVNLGVFQQHDWQELENHLTGPAYHELRRQFSQHEGEESEYDESTESEENRKDHEKDDKDKRNDKDEDKGGNAGVSKEENKKESRRNEQSNHEQEGAASSSSSSFFDDFTSSDIDSRYRSMNRETPRSGETQMIRKFFGG